MNAPTESVTRAADVPPGHVVEAGLDDLELTGSPVQVNEVDRPAQYPMVVPVPNDGTFEVRSQVPLHGALEIYGPTGRMVLSQEMNGQTTLRLRTGLAAGTYFLRLDGDAGRDRILPFVIR